MDQHELYSHLKNKKIKKKMKKWIFSQYHDENTLYIFCDGSCKQAAMGIGICYVFNSKVIIKRMIVKPYDGCQINNIYAELYSIYFAIQNFNKVINDEFQNLVIYSDINLIKRILKQKVKFRNDCLRSLQIDLLKILEEESKRIPIEIAYLQKGRKRHNPFHKKAHNAAYQAVKSEEEIQW